VAVGVVPFFAAITFLTIGITIGANFTAVFTTFDTFIQKQLLLQLLLPVSLKNKTLADNANSLNNIPDHNTK
jgi:hypothetical protein